MLEDHVIPWMERWHVGFGLLGEQGVESVHAHFNTLGRMYRNMAEEVQRLKHLMKEHLLKIAPDNIATAPEIKRRKSKNNPEAHED